MVGQQQFDFRRVFAADLPAPSAKWTGLAKFNFTGGNTDGEQIPLDELVAESRPKTFRVRREIGNRSNPEAPGVVSAHLAPHV